MTRSVLPAVALLTSLAAAGPAMAQTFPLRVPEGGSDGKSIQISVNYGMNLPLKSDDEKSQAEALESARRTLYGIAAGECKVLLATIATECRMERLNVQSNVQRHNPMMQQVHVSANGSYRVTLK
jgi:hypothetical protein